MKPFKKKYIPGAHGGAKKFGASTGGWKKRPAGDGDEARRDLHPATCSACGNSCQVPFKPNGKKPIFCSNCFKHDGSNESRDSRGSREEPGAFGNGKRTFKKDFAPAASSSNVDAQLKAINAKLDAILTAINGAEDETDA